MKMKERFKYRVEWGGKPITFKQDFETIEEARQAMHDHKHHDSRIYVKLKRDYE